MKCLQAELVQRSVLLLEKWQLLTARCPYNPVTVPRHAEPWVPGCSPAE